MLLLSGIRINVDNVFKLPLAVFAVMSMRITYIRAPLFNLCFTF